jgi:hypothetical protein
MEREMIKEIRKQSVQASTPWTKAAVYGISGRPAGESFKAEVYRRLLAEFIVESSSAFSVVEYPTFHTLMRYMQSQVPLIGRRTAQRDIMELHDQKKEEVKEEIATHTQDGGRVSLTMDAWTATNHIPYLGVTGHWIDQSWQLRNKVLAFRRLRGSHTGENLAAVVHNVLEDWKLTEYLRAITADNAAVNDKFFKCLQRIEPRIKRANTQVRCMAHVINLAAQMILKTLKATAPDDESGFDAELDTDETITLTRNAAPHSQATQSGGSPAPRETLLTVRKIFTKIRASNLLWEALEGQCQRLKVSILQPIMDTKTRWNSTHALIQRSLVLKPALNRIVASEKKLHGLHLTAAEWTQLEDLRSLLGIFVSATERLSGSNYPTLAYQLPYFVLLLRELEEYHTEREALQNSPSALLEAEEAGRRHLEKYRDDTANFTSAKMAMLLDPRFKAHGFNQMGWRPAAVVSITAHFNRVYQEQYKAPIDRAAEQRATGASRNTKSLDDLAKVFGSRTTRAPNGMDSPETTRYLCEPCIDLDENPLDWWKANEHRYPIVAKMARDFLAIPASSVPSEQLFSQAGDVITKKRNRLLEQSSSAVLLLKSWLNQKTVDDWEVYGVYGGDDQPAQPEDGGASNRDAPEPPDGARALGEGMDAQQEEVFDSGSDLSDIE